jgi:hypothetical protein
MGSHNIALELLELIGRNANIGEQPDSGIHSVNRVLARRQPLDNGSRAHHPVAGAGREFDRFARDRHSMDLLNSESAVQRNHIAIV